MIEFFIAKRHLVERKKQTFTAITGIAIGITVLIVSIAISNGLDSNMINGILSISPHVTLDNRGYSISDYREVEEKLSDIDGITGIIPNYSTQGILKYQNEYIQAMLGIKIQGINFEKAAKLMKLEDKIVEGEINTDKKTSVLIGKELYDQLGAKIGEKIQITSAENKKINLTIVGVFQTGYLEHDTTLVIIPLVTTQIISEAGDGVKNIDIRIDNPYDAYKISKEVKQRTDYRVRTWGELNSALLKAISLEKTVMIVLFSLIIIVAGFVIGVILNMMVREKTKDIGILRSIGYSSSSIMKIFLFEGACIGVIGIALGLIISMIIIWVIENFIVGILSNIYYLTNVPVEINVREVLVIVFAAMFIIFISSIVPSFRASKLTPMEALKHD